MSDPTIPATLTMSSVEIAKIAGKHHKNVVRDIKDLDRQGVIKALKFEHLQQINNLDGHNTGARTIYLLPKRETLILTSGYSAIQRAAVIDRMLELEAGASSLEAERLRQALLESNPVWGKIYRCRRAGLNNHEIARALECGETSIRRHLGKMRLYGLLPSPASAGQDLRLVPLRGPSPQLDLFGEVQP